MGQTGQSIGLIVRRVRGGDSQTAEDCVATEEPLEIRVGYGGQRRSVSITMRTPGHDSELAAGFLFTEGIVRRPEQISEIVTCSRPNTIRVEVARGVEIDLARLERHFYSTSSCGVCGKSSLEALEVAGVAPLVAGTPLVGANVIHGLAARLRAAQSVFDRTGGLHAAALFDADGELVELREDVGRHNAVDKVIGAMFLANRTPLSETLLFVSGRASFELVQKAVVAGIPMLAAVGAPSSLAVELARKFNLTLLGFVRDERFNIYSGEQRVSA